MKLTYHGHSCFSVTSGNFTVVLDPYKDVPGYKDVDLEADMVLCSHGHFDHAYLDGVHLKSNADKAGETLKENPFTVSVIDCFHDKSNGAERGKNKIHVLKAEGKRIAHFGDLGHNLDEKAIAALKGVDLVMIPVGGYYSIDAKIALEIIGKIDPKFVIPMHYKDGQYDFPHIDDINVFLGLADARIKEKLMLVRGYEESIEI